MWSVGGLLCWRGGVFDGFCCVGTKRKVRRCWLMAGWWFVRFCCRTAAERREEGVERKCW